MKLHLSAWAVALAILSGAPECTAENPQSSGQPSELLPGFKANQVYSAGGVDNVNLFSGDPHVTIPLGPSYPLSPFFSWQPTLHYSAKFWRMAPSACKRWVQNQEQQWEWQVTPRARLQGFPSAGLGWTFHLGVLKPPFATAQIPDEALPVDEDFDPIFYSADGGAHTFEDVPPLPEGVRRTRDGSRMRLHQVGSLWIVTTSDGTRYEFGHSFESPTPIDPGTNGDSPDFTFRTTSRTANPAHKDIPITLWAVDRIIDRAGNTVLTATYTGAKLTTITLTNLGKTVTVGWGSQQINGPQGQGNVKWPVITHIDMPSVHARDLRAQLLFNQTGSGYFLRNPNDEGTLQPPQPCTSPLYALAPMLEQVVISETTAPGIGEPTTPPQTYGFGYRLTPLQEPNFPYESLGALTQITLPTKGRIEYTYASLIPGTYLPPADLLSPSTFPPLNPPPGPSSPINPPQPDRSEFPTEFLKTNFMISSSTFVSSRKEFDPVTQLSSETKYFHKQSYQAGSNSIQSAARRVIVRRPDGNGNWNETLHIFGVSQNRPAFGSGMELLRRSYEGLAESGNLFRSVVSCYSSNGDPERCGYRIGSAYPFDFTSVGAMTDAAPASSVTWYGSEPANGRNCQGSVSTECIETEVPELIPDPAHPENVIPNWDATAGEWRKTVAKAKPNSALAPNGWLSRTNTTTFNSAFVTDTGVWLPKLFSQKTTTDSWSGGCVSGAPCSTTTNYVFDSSGRMTQASIPDGGRTAIFTYSNANPQGAFQKEIRQGTSSDSSLTGSIEVNRVFSVGGLTNTSTNAAFPTMKTFDVDRDAVTGLVTASRDMNGRETGYRYNALGQLGKVLPPDSSDSSKKWKALAPTWICRLPGEGYLQGSGQGYERGDRIFVFRSFTLPCSGFATSMSPTSSIAPALGTLPVEGTEYDGFGRIILEQKFSPSSATEVTVVRRRHAYGENGALRSTTSWYDVPCVATGGGGCFPAAPSPNEQTGTTVYSAFDPLGRPLVETHPDGSIVEHFYNFSTQPHSDLLSRTFLFNAQSFHTVSGQESQTNLTMRTDVQKDLFGRVKSDYQVGSWVSDPGQGTTSFEPGFFNNYQYNVLDKLSRVDTGTQVRTFGYDLLGNLRSERHPEDLGGETTYGRYDILGKNLRRTEPDNTSVVSSYDALGRLLTVGVDSVPPATYIVNEYDTAAPGAPFGGTQLAAGMLTKATSHNYSAQSPLTVEQTFYYSADSRGGLSSKKTSILQSGTPLLDSYFEHFTYDELGNTTRYAHPRPSSQAPFISTTDYQYGVPTRVLAGGVPVVRQATYAPYGGLKSFVSSAGYPGIFGSSSTLPDSSFPAVTTTITPDPHGVPRPFAITTAGSNFSVNLGAYSYDGAGNIKQIGADKYYYDGRGRIVRSEVTAGVTPEDHRYAYDFQSNLTAVTSYTSGVGTPFKTFGIDTYSTVGFGNGPSNRLSSVRLGSGATLGVTYDQRGNLIALDAYGETYAYDPLDRMKSSTQNGQTWNYFYDAFGERIGKATGSAFVFTLRDPQARVVTEIRREGGVNTIVRDNFYLGGTLVGSRGSCFGNDGWEYYSTDHLGSGRLAWGIDGALQGGPRKFRPFGEEITSAFGQQRIGFAGMEQDREELSASRMYVHARSYDARLSRFVAPDVLVGVPESPESWNRYTYAFNDPLNYIDRDGRSGELAIAASSFFGGAGTGTTAATTAATGTTTVVGGAASLLTIPAFILGGAVGLRIGEMETSIGDVTVNQLVEEAFLSHMNPPFVHMSKSKGGGRDSGLVNVPTPTLEERYRQARGEERMRLQRELKNRKDSSKGNKARGGGREPKKPKQEPKKKPEPTPEPKPEPKPETSQGSTSGGS